MHAGVPMPRIAALLSTLLTAALPAGADEVVLRNGSVLEGIVREEDARVVGGSITLDRREVAEIRRPKALVEEYERRLRDRDGQGLGAYYDLALWAREQGLESRARILMRKVLEIDPDHEGARRALGYHLYKGVWLTRDPYLRTLGLLEYRGEWLPRETAEAYRKMDYDLMAAALRLSAEAQERGVEFFFGARVERVQDGTVVARGQRIEARYLINCAGLHADQIAHMMGVGLDYRIIPFRGEYYELHPHRSYLVNSMLYPTPNLRFPFLGIHFTRRTDGRVIVGPNAVLALGRESYRPWQVSPSDTLAMLASRHFWRLITRREFLRQAACEIRTSVSKRQFVAAARRLIPEIRERDLTRGMAGIRAQLVDRQGRLVEDFVQQETENSTHILNTVSPGLTSALALAEHLAPEIVLKAGLRRR